MFPTHRFPTLLAIVAAMALFVSACGATDLVTNDDGGDQQDNDDGEGGDDNDGDVGDMVAQPVDPGTAAAAELFVPPILEVDPNAPVAEFALELGPSQHAFGDRPAVETIAYNGQGLLGPTMRWTEGQATEITVTNQLAEPTTAHWHGADVPAASDGGPHSRIDPGQSWTASFGVIQPAATLWYHPHLMGTTAEQVYAGAAGMIIVDDDNPNVADLPSTYGVDDVPIVLQDREFNADGSLRFELANDEHGDLNPVLTVNGTVDPYQVVPSGPVRLRILNGSQARVYRLGVDSGSMQQIAGDGGYLSRAVDLDTVVIAPGDRAEIIVDTSNGAVNLIDRSMGRVVELRPDPSLPAASFPDGELASVPDLGDPTVDQERTFVLDEVGDRWGINGRTMDRARVDERIAFGSTERWTVRSEEGVHSFHVHQVQFRIESINGAPPPPELAGWEDTVLVDDDDEVVFIARFDSYRNPDVPYMFHCHILDHEDLGMMGQFSVT